MQATLAITKVVILCRIQYVHVYIFDRFCKHTAACVAINGKILVLKIFCAKNFCRNSQHVNVLVIMMLYDGRLKCGEATGTGFLP